MSNTHASMAGIADFSLTSLMWVDFLSYHYLLWLHADVEEAADSKNAVMDFLHPTFASLDLERIKN